MTSIGVVGVGYWGPKLARNFNEIQEADLSWVCDLDEGRLSHIAGLYPGVRTTRSFRELLASDVEAVCITTPVRTHCQLAIEALRAGKHVLVEKPLAASAREAELIVLEAERQNRIAMVGHTFIYNPAVRAMKQIIASGELGEIFYIDGARVNLGLFQPDINVAWDLAPHDISILLDVMSQDPIAASARGGIYVQRRRNLHEVAHLTLDFPGGVFADIRVSWLDPCKIRRYTVVGSDKMLVYDDVEPVDKIVIYDRGVDVPPYSDTEEQFHCTYRTGDGVPYPIDWKEPLRAECEHFLTCIRTGASPLTDAYAGLKVVQVLEAAQRSLENGGNREPIDWSGAIMPAMRPAYVMPEDAALGRGMVAR